MNRLWIEFYLTVFVCAKHFYMKNWCKYRNLRLAKFICFLKNCHSRFVLVRLKTYQILWVILYQILHCRRTVVILIKSPYLGGADKVIQTSFVGYFSENEYNNAIRVWTRSLQCRWPAYLTTMLQRLTTLAYLARLSYYST